MEQALQRAWLRRGLLARLLWPLSLVFGTLARLRRLAYAGGLLRSEAAGVPVVVVGNVLAGGSGKTPVVKAVVEHLQARGLRVGVISRGYGRTTRDCREVRAESDAHEVGDEPLLVARTCRAPVFVAPRRIDAARALLDAHPDTQVLVSDDGLQHHALQRDIEICVFDARGVGNGWLMPAGPLRERWPRQVDFVLRPATAAGIEGFDVHRRLAGHAVRADGQAVDLTALQGRPLHAVAGIGRPDAFFAMLRDAGLTLADAQGYPDHHDYAHSPLPDGELVCTEKDAVKLWKLRPDAWAVPLAIEIDPRFWRAFDHLLEAKLSSPDGPQTA